MDVLEAIKTRRSVRKYKKKPIPEEHIKKILDAGRWAPSAWNAQHCRFIVLSDGDVRKEVAKATTTHGKFLADAQLGIAVVIDPNGSKHAVEDGAIATQNILLASHSLGISGCWIGSYGMDYEDYAKEVMNIPRDRRLLSIIALGYPDEFPKSQRKELGEIVFRDKYGKK